MVVHELFSYLYLPLHDSRLLESQPWGEMTAEIVRGLTYKLPQAGQSKTGKSGATSRHILFVCVCVCVQLWGERCILHSRRFFAGAAACLDLAGILCLSLPVWVEKHTAEKETGAWVFVHVGGGMLTFRWRLDQEEVEGGVDEWHEGLHTHAWTWMKSNIEDKVDCSMGTRIILALVSELILMTSIKLLLVIQFKVWRGS